MKENLKNRYDTDLLIHENKIKVTDTVTGFSVTSPLDFKRDVNYQIHQIRNQLIEIIEQCSNLNNHDNGDKPDRKNRKWL